MVQGNEEGGCEPACEHGRLSTGTHALRTLLQVCDQTWCEYVVRRVALPPCSMNAWVCSLLITRASLRLLSQLLCCMQALERINSSVSTSDVKRHLAYMQKFGSV